MILTKYLISKMKKNEIIDGDIEIYSYGLNSFFTLLINIITAVTIAYIVQKYDILICFFITFIPLRSFSGGFHFSSRFVCYIISNFLVLTVLLIQDYLYLNLKIILLISIFASCYLFIVKTSSTKVRLLDTDEIEHYTHKKRFYLIANNVIILLCISIRLYKYATTVMCSIFVTLILVIIGKLVNIRLE